MIQELIDAAQNGDTVTVPPDNYWINAIDSPIWIKKPLTLALNGARIWTTPNAANDRVYFPIGITDCEDVMIIGGTIIGDKVGHIGTTPAGFGHGIAIGSAKKVKLQSVTLTQCMGDGIVVVGGYQVEIDRVTSYLNRRQGLTASQVDELWIHDSQFSQIGGAEPGAGIDLEPDLPSQQILDVKVERCKFFSNAGAGVLINCPPPQRHNINIMSDNVFYGKPIDGTDGIVSWLAKLIGPYTNWVGYPRELHI